jgi:hypothetical protein
MAEPRLSIGKINIIKLWVNGILIPTEIAWTNLPSSKNVNVNDITEIKVPSKKYHHCRNEKWFQTESI